MIELVSVPALLARPRLVGGAWHYTHSHWTRPETVALKALCEADASLEKSAAALGRSPTSLAHRASDTGLTLPREWRAAIYKYKPKPKVQREAPLQYPYIKDVRGEHQDLLAVNALAPRGLPDYERADVCQEIMLALWQKEVTLNELRQDKSLLRKFTSGFRKANFELGGYALSLDQPMSDGRSWYDILPDEPEFRL